MAGTSGMYAPGCVEGEALLAAVTLLGLKLDISYYVQRSIAGAKVFAAPSVRWLGIIYNAQHDVWVHRGGRSEHEVVEALQQALSLGEHLVRRSAAAPTVKRP